MGKSSILSAPAPHTARATEVLKKAPVNHPLVSSLFPCLCSMLPHSPVLSRPARRHRRNVLFSRLSCMQHCSSPTADSEASLQCPGLFLAVACATLPADFRHHSVMPHTWFTRHSTDLFRVGSRASTWMLLRSLCRSSRKSGSFN